MADDGFGADLGVARDAVRHAGRRLPLDAEPHVARPEVDFGVSGSVLKGGVGYVVLSQGGRMVRRLLVTHDAGRHWRVAHRWR